MSPATTTATRAPTTTAAAVTVTWCTRGLADTSPLYLASRGVVPKCLFKSRSMRIPKRSFAALCFSFIAPPAEVCSTSSSVAGWTFLRRRSSSKVACFCSLPSGRRHLSVKGKNYRLSGNARWFEVVFINVLFGSEEGSMSRYGFDILLLICQNFDLFYFINHLLCSLDVSFVWTIIWAILMPRTRLERKSDSSSCF